MVSIKTQKDLDNWLYKKPIAYAQIIACRSALRVLPLLIPLEVYLPARDIPISARPVFRGALVCWAARAYPKFDFHEAAKLVWSGSTGLIKSASETEWIVEGSVGGISARDAIYQAASQVCVTAAREVGIRQSDFSPSSKLTPAQNHVLKFKPGVAEVWENAEQDATWLDTNGAPDHIHAASVLAREPLWNDEYPSEISDVWTELKAQLERFNEDWGVWIDWYERRLTGEATSFGLPPDIDERFTVELALEKSAFWDREPAIVNTEIIARLDKAQSLARPVAPAQSHGAPRFQVQSDDLIDIAPPENDWRLDVTPRARTQYAELLKAFQKLKNLSNQFGENIAELIDEFEAALPDEIGDVDPDLFFSRFNRLRRLLEGHKNRVNSCRLSDDVAFALEGVRDDGNILLTGQSKLLEIQSHVPNPVSAQAVEQRYRRIEVVLTLNAQNPEVTLPAARAEVVRAVEDGKIAPETPIDQAAKAQSQLTQKNYFYTSLEKFVNLARGFGGKLGEGAAKKLGEQAVEGGEKFVEDMLNNSDDIVKFVEDEAPEYASWIEDIFSHWTL